MKHTNKRGFVLIELVIVIAIIAILAAAVISIMSGVVEKAERSKDIQTIRNLNTAVIVDAQLKGPHKTLYDAGQAALDAGYNVEKILGERTHIGWDSKNDRFVYIEDNGKIVYTPDDKNLEQVTEIGVEIFKVYQAKSAADADSYGGKHCSIYAGEHWNDANIEVSVGFDAGSRTNIETVTYKRLIFDGAQNIVIRTNGSKLTINAPADDVKHYGVVNNLTVTAVNELNCYHECGTLVHLDSFGIGKFKVEKGAKLCQTMSEIEAIVGENFAQKGESSQYEQESPLKPADPYLAIIEEIEKDPQAATAIYAAVIEGKTSYVFNSLPEAFAGETIFVLLLQNDSGEFLVSANSNLTLDINGKVLTCDEDGLGAIADATFTIRDNKGTGKVRASEICSFGSAFIIESGNYEVGQFGMLGIGTDGIVIKGGTFNVDPTEYVDGNYKVEKNGSLWTVVAK